MKAFSDELTPITAFDALALLGVIAIAAPGVVALAAIVLTLAGWWRVDTRMRSTRPTIRGV